MKCCEVRRKTTGTDISQYGSNQFSKNLIIWHLQYRICLLSICRVEFKNKQYLAYERFIENGRRGKISTKKDPIRRLGFS